MTNMHEHALLLQQQHFNQFVSMVSHERLSGVPWDGARKGQYAMIVKCKKGVTSPSAMVLKTILPASEHMGHFPAYMQPCI